MVDYGVMFLSSVCQSSPRSTIVIFFVWDCCMTKVYCIIHIYTLYFCQRSSSNYFRIYFQIYVPLGSALYNLFHFLFPQFIFDIPECSLFPISKSIILTLSEIMKMILQLFIYHPLSTINIEETFLHDILVIPKRMLQNYWKIWKKYFLCCYYMESDAPSTFTYSTSSKCVGFTHKAAQMCGLVAQPILEYLLNM